MRENDALTYYATGDDDLLPIVLDALATARRPTDPLDPDDLAALDEFHGRGRSATVALVRLAGLREGERVLDVGAGIGGPTRTLARHFGAAAVGLEPTDRFRALAAELNRRSGLADRIELVAGRAEQLPFDDGSFDLVLNQALWPSVADKPALLAEAHRVLAPGGRLAVFEIVVGPEPGPLGFPLPWGDGPAESHLVSAAEGRALAEAAGFQAETWLTGLEALTATLDPAEAGDPLLAEGVAGVDLGLLMPDHEARMAALGENIGGRRIELLLGVLRRSPAA
jgi:sarcosine/dimethylglycine N-methyltransferase